jgi:hypothetical protein
MNEDNYQTLHIILHLRGTDKPDMEGTQERYLQLGMKLHSDRGHFKTDGKMII